ncbi:hypothetical protein BJV78DRAFT_1183419 [Lactifluus subvellereus]|nr:hypothetical protein BJV78DRAFT_1183419 [Lactifluus subvellereus]
MERQAVPGWRGHVHINGTIYYSLARESQDEEWPFLRIVTAEDITDPDIREAIEDCGREYHQWLEEADLEDLPDDLELVIFFDNPRNREPIGTFVSHQRGVEFVCCPRESEDSESESGSASESSSTGSAVVVEVQPMQSYWLTLESYPMHHTRCHRNLEVAFFAALTHSANEHISGKGNAAGRFNFQECRRLIELFLELKVVSTEPECGRDANAAVVWHLSRVMHEIDLHRYQREPARRLPAQPFPKPSKVIDGVLTCMFVGVHLIYRERIQRTHPLSRVSLADFRAFIQTIMSEWSDANLLATVFVAANVTFLAAPGITTFQRTASIASTLLSLLEIVTGLHHIWRHRIRANADYDDLYKYFGKKWIGTGYTFHNPTLLAAMLSVPIASLLWSVLCFMAAVSAYCLQSISTDTGRRILLGFGIGTFALLFPLAVLFFSDVWKGTANNVTVS